MKSGFTYKGRHSSEFDIIAKTKSRPVLPEMKSFTFDTPTMDGVYDFSQSNEYGHAFYNDRFFEVLLQVSADNLRSLEKKVSQIAVWLRGGGELSFDDMPFVKWNARVISELGFVPELRGRKAALTAVFRVEPFSRCFFDTANGPDLSSVIGLESNIPVDVPSRFEWQLTGGVNTYKNVACTMKVLNAGNVYIRPVIRFVGDIKNVAVGYGTKGLSVNAAESEIVIDFKRCVVYNSENLSLMKNVSGNFFDIDEIVGTVNISAYVNGNATVTVEYEPRFVYNFDFDDVDWSESNAQTV